MQLDRTEIVIRQRSVLELLDLSLLVLRAHFWKILQSSAIVGLPLLAIDILLLQWMLHDDAWINMDYYDDGRAGMQSRFRFHLIVNYLLQFQLATLATTIFLGGQTFYTPKTIREQLSQMWKMISPTIIALGLTRLGLVSIGLELAVDDRVIFGGWAEIVLFFMVLPTNIILRLFWPFAPEIIGLEGCMLRKSNSDTIHYSARSRSIHPPFAGDNFVRFMLVALAVLLLFLMIAGVCLFLAGTITGNWYWSLPFDLIVLPLCLWLTGMFAAVFRFLSYLDCRIRLEGWELELRLRAEGDRIRSRSQTAIGTKIAPSQPDSKGDQDRTGKPEQRVSQAVATVPSSGEMIE